MALLDALNVMRRANMEEPAKHRYNAREILEPVFLKAQGTDEFEFGCSLLRIRGLQDAGWDPLIESNNVINQVLLLIHAPIESTLKIRLLLFLYCHATEMDELYIVVANLLRVCRGDRCAGYPFDGALHPNGQEAKSPSAKIARISELSKEVGFEIVGEMLEHMLVKQVRNAFFHSDYTLYDDEFRIKHGEGVLFDNMLTRVVPIDWLVPRLELGVNFALATIGLIRQFIGSYKEEKIVPSRIRGDGENEDLLLTVHPGFGLSGFRSLTDEDRRKYNLTGA